MCDVDRNFNNDLFYAGKDPMQVLSDQEFLDWVAGKDLEE